MAAWHHSLEFFGQVCLGIGDLRNFELVGVGEDHIWSDDINISVEISSSIIRTFKSEYN